VGALVIGRAKQARIEELLAQADHDALSLRVLVRPRQWERDAAHSTGRPGPRGIVELAHAPLHREAERVADVELTEPLLDPVVHVAGLAGPFRHELRV